MFIEAKVSDSGRSVLVNTDHVRSAEWTSVSDGGAVEVDVTFTNGDRTSVTVMSALWEALRELTGVPL